MIVLKHFVFPPVFRSDLSVMVSQSQRVDLVRLRSGREREREEEGKTERSSRKKFDTGSKYPDRSTLSIKSIRDNTIPRLTSFAISEPAFFPVASLIKRKVIRGPSNFDGNDFFFYICCIANPSRLFN